MPDTTPVPLVDESRPAQPRLRTLSVEIPEEVYWHIRQCVIASRLSMKDYMTRVCREARPYSPDGPSEDEYSILPPTGPVE